MTPHSNRELVQRYLDAIRKDKSPATLDKYLADDELRKHILTLEAAFPGYWLEVEDMVAENDRVFVRATIHAVHKGKFGDLPPTGKTVTAPLFIVYKITHGKIVNHWMLADNMSIMQQLGAIPAHA